MVFLPATMIAGLHSLRERFDAVLFDLDGTLLDGASRVTARTYRAVRGLVDVGFDVLLCTGRSASGSLSVYRGLGLDTPLVAYNGGWIGRPGRPPWRRTPIPDEVVADVRRTETHAEFAFRHSADRKFSVVSSHPVYARVAAWYDDVLTVHREIDLPQRDLMRVSCFFECGESSDRAWEGLSEAARGALYLQRFPLRIFPDFSDTDLFLGEIQPLTEGKAEVFNYLHEVRGIPASRTIAVGDQRNDLTMLANAGLAVSVANGVDEVLAVADLVIGRNDDEGIATWIEAGMPTNGAPSSS